MKRALLLALALPWSGCTETRCEDLKPEPLLGSYRAGASLGEERMHRVTFEVKEDEVVLDFTTPDGSRIRAKYRVSEKRKVVE